MERMVCAVLVAVIALPACATSRRVGGRLLEGESSAATDGAPEVAEHGGVRRARSRDGSHLVLRTMLEIGDWRIGLVGSPEVRTERVGMTLAGPRLSAVYAPGCELRVMVDGVLLGVLEHERYRPRERHRDALLAARIELTRLVAMSAGERVAMRICGDEVRFGPSERQQVREFLLQYREEQRWRDPVVPQDVTAVPESETDAP